MKYFLFDVDHLENHYVIFNGILVVLFKIYLDKAGYITDQISTMLKETGNTEWPANGLVSFLNLRSCMHSFG